MKKFFLIGLIAGTAISLFIYFLRKVRVEGMEFHNFVDSTSVADDLFGNAFDELPDQM